MALERVDLTVGQTPTEADWESWFNRVIDFINAGIPGEYLQKVNGKLEISITGDAATVGGKSVDQIVAGDFSEVKTTLIDLINGGDGLVIKGGVATKNGSNPARLDITACTAVQKDGEYIDRVDLAAGYKTTSVSNTIYFLDITPGAADYSWGTSHPAGSYVTLATVTTDLNGQIGTVTDTRPLTASLFKGFDCSITMPVLEGRVSTLESSKASQEAAIANMGTTVSALDTKVTGVQTTNTSHINDAALHQKLFRIGHTYAIPGAIAVPSGDTNYILPFFVSLAAGQTAKLAKCRYRINSGTSVTCKLQKNGADITGYSGMSVTTTAGETDAADIALADNDMIQLVVTAISGTPKNLTATIFIDYEQ